MKRFFTLSVCCAAVTFAAQAQEIKVPDIESLRKDVVKLNADTANPKKKESPKTWIARGEKLVKVYDKATMSAAPNMHKAIFSALTKNTASEKVADQQYDVLVFPSIKLYFDSLGVLAFWKETTSAVDQPLSQAYASYLRAIALDAQGKQAKKEKEALSDLAAKLRAEGANAYAGGSLKLAQRYFVEAVEAARHPLVGRLDTSVAYYAGLMSLTAEALNYEDAIRYFKLCIDNSYTADGSIYSSIAKAYEGVGDSVSRKQALLDGFAKFPSNQAILIELINLYMSSGEDPIRIIDLLKRAQELEPSNATLYFAEGMLYEKLKMPEDAERIYLKTVEVDSSNYNAYYNIGALYYNKAVEYTKELTEIKDYKSPKIKELKGKVNDELKRALRPFVRAYELQPNDKFALENIKNIYYHFSGESKEMADKFKEYNEKLMQLQGTAEAQ
ncbi:MAG: hypothetical protein LBS63_00180 [Prevotellaceae bacterium]|jgi:tetratricopeptide (TPR) repeat protein|nr:hypothetical protein [Prevotellaceae bacterium]